MGVRVRVRVTTLPQHALTHLARVRVGLRVGG